MPLDKKYIFTIIPFICFFIGYIICNFLIGSKAYVTPNLTGLSIYEAVKVTSAHQINIRIISEKESQDVAPGTIISQKPSAGREIKTHQSIFIITTKTPPPIITPNLTGQSSSQIEQQCNDLKLKYKCYPLEFPAPTNSCIAQFPAAKTIIQDKKILLYTAQEKSNMYLMPDLINQKLNPVLTTLSNYTDKVTIYQGKQKLSPPFKEDLTVVVQKPLAGSIIPLQSPLHIQLQVS